MKRKSNPAQRITDAMLDRRVDLLNQVLGRPETPWTKKAGGGMKANIGNLHISGAYGGVSLHEMMNEGGGVNDISQIGYVPKRELYNFINGMLATAEFRQKNPITPGQLENFVYEMDSSGRDELRGALKYSVMASKDFSISAAKRKIYKDLSKLLRKEIKKFDPSRGDYPSRNPTRKKTMARKKKRSAKQLANDRRLGRMAKARAKKKRGGRRKTRKNPRTYSKKAAKKVATFRRKSKAASKKRTALKKSHLWFVFKCKGKAVYYAVMRGKKAGWSLTKGNAVLFSTKGSAASVARILQQQPKMTHWRVGAASRESTASQIAAKCSVRIATGKY